MLVSVRSGHFPSHPPERVDRAEKYAARSFRTVDSLEVSVSQQIAVRAVGIGVAPNDTAGGDHRRGLKCNRCAGKDDRREIPVPQKKATEICPAIASDSNNVTVGADPVRHRILKRRVVDGAESSFAQQKPVVDRAIIVEAHDFTTIVDPRHVG